MTTTTPSPPTTGPADDQAAIAGVAQSVVAAWAAHDADAFAGVFTEDGTMILPGLFRKGRDDIRSFMAEAFAGPYKGTQVTGQPIDLKIINSETVLMITQGGVLAPGETEVSGEAAIRASWLVVKRDGKWLLTAYQNSPRGDA